MHFPFTIPRKLKLKKSLLLRESTKNNPAREAFLNEFEIQEALGIINDWISASKFLNANFGLVGRWRDNYKKWPELFVYMAEAYPYENHRLTLSTGPR